jgi:type I restriction enzyme, S subunit
MNKVSTGSIQAINKLIPELRFPEFVKEGEWEEKNLGSICDVTNGKANVQDHVVGGKFPLFDRSELIKATNNYIFDCEAVIIPGEGMRFVPKYYKGKFNLHQRAYALKDFTCDGQFVYFSMLHRSNLLSQKAVQSTVLSLRLPILQNFPIEIPQNPNEQQKIASCLSSLDELIAAHSQKLEALKIHKKGLMHNLFPQEGETVPKYRFPEFNNDGKWVFERLNKIATISSGSTPSRVKTEYWNGNIPWVSTTLIDFNEIKRVNEFITPLGLENSSTKIFPKGTILMAMYGQGKTRGKVAILDLDAAINQACAAITLKKGMNINFVFQNLAARYDEIRSISNQGGQENLSGELIKNIPIVYPNIKSGEQKRIADCLSSLDALITAQAEKIEQLKLHKKGLMQGLFPKIND